jgi:hypothetical protein
MGQLLTLKAPNHGGNGNKTTVHREDAKSAK